MHDREQDIEAFTAKQLALVELECAAEETAAAEEQQSFTLKQLEVLGPRCSLRRVCAHARHYARWPARGVMRRLCCAGKGRGAVRAAGRRAQARPRWAYAHDAGAEQGAGRRGQPEGRRAAAAAGAPVANASGQLRAVRTSTLQGCHAPCSVAILTLRSEGASVTAVCICTARLPQRRHRGVARVRRLLKDAKARRQQRAPRPGVSRAGNQDYCCCGWRERG